MNTLENNQLYSENKGRKTFPKPQRKGKSPVSIIIGIICKGGIVLASDSQTSWGSTKRTDTEKVHFIDFKNAGGIICNSGDAAISSAVVESVEAMCAGQEITDARQFAEITQKAVEQMRRLLMQPYLSLGSKPEDFQKLFNDHNFSILVANYYNGNPAMYSLDFPPGIPAKQKSYAAIGCGADLATFLLRWFDFSKMDCVETCGTAAFIIGEVKKANHFCGGKTQIGFLIEERPCLPTMVDRDTLEWTEREIEFSMFKLRHNWANEVYGMIHRGLGRKIKFDAQAKKLNSKGSSKSKQNKERTNET